MSAATPISTAIATVANIIVRESNEHLGLLGIDFSVYCAASLVNHRREERGQEMTITRHSEGIEISDIIGGYRVSELYIGYTIREARAIFRAKHLTR